MSSENWYFKFIDFNVVLVISTLPLRIFVARAVILKTIEAYVVFGKDKKVFASCDCTKFCILIIFFILIRGIKICTLFYENYTNGGL